MPSVFWGLNHTPVYTIHRVISFLSVIFMFIYQSSNVLTWGSWDTVWIIGLIFTYMGSNISVIIFTSIITAILSLICRNYTIIIWYSVSSVIMFLSLSWGGLFTMDIVTYWIIIAMVHSSYSIRSKYSCVHMAMWNTIGTGVLSFNVDMIIRNCS